MNATLAHTLAAFTLDHAYTHNYALLVEKSGFMYISWIRDITLDEMLEVAALDRPSSKHADRGATLRYKGRATAAYKLGLRRNALQCIGTAAAYKADAKEWRAAHKGCNNGDYFEYVVARMNNVFWDGHNSDDGREKGDLIINGVHWQLKANGGNYATESQMRRW